MDRSMKKASKFSKTKKSIESDYTNVNSSLIESDHRLDFQCDAKNYVNSLIVKYTK